MHSSEWCFPFRAMSREWRCLRPREIIVLMDAIPLIRARYLQAFAAASEGGGRQVGKDARGPRKSARFADLAEVELERLGSDHPVHA
jgi:hypothetical protein